MKFLLYVSYLRGTTPPRTGTHLVGFELPARLLGFVMVSLFVLPQGTRHSSSGSCESLDGARKLGMNSPGLDGISGYASGEPETQRKKSNEREQPARLLANHGPKHRSAWYQEGSLAAHRSHLQAWMVFFVSGWTRGAGNGQRREAEAEVKIAIAGVS